MSGHADVPESSGNETTSAAPGQAAGHADEAPGSSTESNTDHQFDGQE